MLLSVLANECLSENCQLYYSSFANNIHLGCTAKSPAVSYVYRHDSSDLVAKKL